MRVPETDRSLLSLAGDLVLLTAPLRRRLSFPKNAFSRVPAKQSHDVWRAPAALRVFRRRTQRLTPPFPVILIQNAARMHDGVPRHVVRQRFSSSRTHL